MDIAWRAAFGVQHRYPATAARVGALSGCSCGRPICPWMIPNLTDSPVTRCEIAFLLEYEQAPSFTATLHLWLVSHCRIKSPP
jgi:hypothetical protein